MVHMGRNDQYHSGQQVTLVQIFIMYLFKVYQHLIAFMLFIKCHLYEI